MPQDLHEFLPNTQSPARLSVIPMLLMLLELLSKHEIFGLCGDEKSTRKPRT